MKRILPFLIIGLGAVSSATVVVRAASTLTPGTTYRFKLRRADGTLAGAWGITAAAPLHVVGMLPGDQTTDVPQDTVFPCMSVIVTSVLLNVAFTWAMPSASTTRFVFFPVAILLGHLLLACDCATRTLLGACVGVCALAPDGETAPMSYPAIRANVHQAFDVHRNLGAQGTFDTMILFNRLAEFVDIRFGQVADAQIGTNYRLLQNGLRRGATYPENVRQPDLNALLARKVYSRYTRHISLVAACA